MLVDSDVYDDYVLCDGQPQQSRDGANSARSIGPAAAEVAAKNPSAAAAPVKEKPPAKEPEEADKTKKSARMIDREALLAVLREVRRDRAQSLGFLILSATLFVVLLAIAVWQHGEIHTLKEKVEQLSVVLAGGSNSAGAGGSGTHATIIADSLRSLRSLKCSSIFPDKFCASGQEILGRLRDRSL